MSMLFNFSEFQPQKENVECNNKATSIWLNIGKNAMDYSLINLQRVSFKLPQKHMLHYFNLEASVIG